MSAQSTLSAFPSYPARLDYKEAALQLTGVEAKMFNEELPSIEGWIYTAQGFPVPALCAPFPQFDSSAECYSAKHILSGTKYYIADASHYYICYAISSAGGACDWRIANDLRNYIAGCLIGDSADVATYSSFIRTVQFCFESDVIYQSEELDSNYKDGRIFWIDWMLHQVAQQLTNFTGEQA